MVVLHRFYCILSQNFRVIKSKSKSIRILIISQLIYIYVQVQHDKGRVYKYHDLYISNKKLKFKCNCTLLCNLSDSRGHLLAHFLYRGSYMSAHALLNLLNKLGKSDKMRGLPSLYLFFATSLINSIIQEHEC